LPDAACFTDESFYESSFAGATRSSKDKRAKDIVPKLCLLRNSIENEIDRMAVPAKALRTLNSAASISATPLPAARSRHFGFTTCEA